MSLNESIVEDAALEWFGELGYAVGHGPHLAPGEPAAERDSFGEVVLVGRLREAIRRLNPAIPEEAREEALRKVLRAKFPQIDRLKLTDYKVRVIDATQGTATAVRALIETTDGETEWGTVGAHENIIEASYQALVDSLVYGLMLHMAEAEKTDE